VLHCVPLILAAFGLSIAAYPFMTTRWWVLMRARAMHVTWFKAFRLVMVGSFFNFCMPVGTTAGDVVKSFYAARGSGRLTDSVMTIVVDRVLGLVGLVVLSLVIGLTMIDHPQVRGITVSVAIGAGVLFIGAFVYFSRALHGVLRINHWLHKLPGGRVVARVDEAALAYRDHKSALVAGILLSLGSHIFFVFSTALAGKALNIDQGWGLLMSVVPLLFMCAALPISPQGLGTTEALGIALLGVADQTNHNAIISMIMLWRIYQIVLAIGIGGPFLLKGDIHLHPQREELQEPESSAASACSE